MFFNVKELEIRKARFDVAIAPGEIDFLDPSLRQVSSIEAKGTAELLPNTLGEIRVHGQLSATMEVDCDRCLETTRYPLESDFDLFYRPAPPVQGHHAAEEVQIDEGEAEIAFYQGLGIELNDVLREHILLSLPMQRICGEACKGICPVCGQNRNTVECACHVKLADDRWAALKNLSTRGS